MFLSEVIGRQVYAESGDQIGRLIDLVVSPVAQFPSVVAIAIQTPHGEPMVLPWSEIEDFARSIRLASNVDTIRTYQIKEDDLLLKRNVLDKQIVDVHDYRVVRVNDVRLELSEKTMFLVGVDTGMRGLLRRIGLEKILDRLIRKTKWRPHTQIIAWNDVETLEGRLRLKVETGKIGRLHPSDIAKIVEELDPAQRTEIFESMDVEKAADTLAETDPQVQISIVESLDEELAADILGEMGPDEAADVLGDMSQERRDEILSEMEPDEAQDVKELLEYEDETAGGLMTNEFIFINEDMSAEAIIDHLRAVEPDAEMVYYVYVLDQSGRLTGVISLRDLIVSQPQTKAADFMVRQVIHVHVNASVQDIAQNMEDYNLLALPVVDDENKMQGIVTFDDTLRKVLPEQWRRKIPKD